MSDILVTEICSDLGNTIFSRLKSGFVSFLGYEETIFQQFLQSDVKIFQSERTLIKIKVILVTIKTLEQFMTLMQTDDMVVFPTGEKVVTCIDIPLNGCGTLVSDKYEFPLHITEHSHGMFAYVFLYLHIRVIVFHRSSVTIGNPVVTHLENTTALMCRPTGIVLNNCISIPVIASKIVFCF